MQPKSLNNKNTRYTKLGIRNNINFLINHYTFKLYGKELL